MWRICEGQPLQDDMQVIPAAAGEPAAQDAEHSSPGG